MFNNEDKYAKLKEKREQRLWEKTQKQLEKAKKKPAASDVPPKEPKEKKSKTPWYKNKCKVTIVLLLVATVVAAWYAGHFWFESSYIFSITNSEIQVDSITIYT